MNMESKFGGFGGQYVPETLMHALHELEEKFREARTDPAFIEEFKHYLHQYVGRPSPLYYARGLSEYLGGAKIYLKREDLNHTGAHKINNVLGQVLLAKKMGKEKIIAETGAGQHGVASATGAALFGMSCTVFMGEEDINRQRLNVFKMKLLGAQVKAVTTGTKTLKDATNEAIREWVRCVEDTFYIIGSVVGPHPYPAMVRHFQSIIGVEAREQILKQENRLPDMVVACVGGGSNAIGIFNGFIEDSNVQLVGVEAAGLGLDSGKHAAALAKGSVGIIHGMKTFVCQDENGNILPVHSISAGLDYPGIGPEHAWLYESKRAEYVSATDHEALDAFYTLTKFEGIIPALESSHAIAHVMKTAGKMTRDQIIIINLSGRGDKDVYTVGKYKGEDL